MSVALNLLTVVFLLSLLYVLSTLLIGLVRFWYNHQHDKPLHALHAGLGKWFIIGTGLFIYLWVKQAKLTPFFIGMGATSIIVGLALQETLSNLFAGLVLDFEGILRRGEWIRIEGEGGNGW